MSDYDNPIGSAIAAARRAVYDIVAAKDDSEQGTVQASQCEPTGAVLEFEKPESELKNPEAAIAELAEQNVGPDTFHAEDEQTRFQSLTACTTDQKKRIAELESKIAHYISSSMSPEQIAHELEERYNGSYKYDTETGRMVLRENADDVDDATKLKARKAKTELGLWIAAVDHEARVNKTFRTEVRKEPRIHRVMALNSEDLTPKDRTDFHRLEAANKLGDKALEIEYQKQHKEWWKDSFKWLKAYNGSPASEGTFWSSTAVFNGATDTILSKTKLDELNKNTFPYDVVSREIVDYIKEHPYFVYDITFAISKPNDYLVGADHSFSQRYGSDMRTNKQTAEKQHAIAIVLASRGLSDKQWQQLQVEYYKGEGFTEDNVRLATDRNKAAGTATRLDDYDFIDAAGDAYEQWYRKVAETPPEEWHSSPDFKEWYQWDDILDPSKSAIPISSNDLSERRAKIRQKSLLKSDGPISKEDFYNRDLKKVQIYTGEEMGACGGSADGPLMASAEMMVHGMNVGQTICENGGILVFMPDNLLPETEHHVKTADKKYLGFAPSYSGISIMRNNGSNDSDAMILGELVNTVFHESLHHWEKKENLVPNHDWIRYMGDLAQAYYFSQGMADRKEILAFMEANGGILGDGLKPGKGVEAYEKLLEQAVKQKEGG